MSGSSREPSTALVPATAHGLLADDEARAVAVAVAEAGGPVSTDALATMLAARAGGRPPGRIDPDRRRRIRFALEGDHLPRLCAHGVLERVDGGRYAPGPELATLVAVADAVAARLGPDDDADRGRRSPPAP